MAKKKINKALLIQGIGQIGMAFAEGYKTNKLGSEGGGKGAEPRLRSEKQPSYKPKKIKGLYDQYKPFGS
jgi:hypothetical protein|tara:strand:- start:42 stop:251 length:210 start_codon:yes stop_codon:yes gene_type:complete